MLKKTIVLAAFVGFAFPILAPAPTSAKDLTCSKKRYTGSARGPTKSAAKAAARLKWRINVLKSVRAYRIIWSIAKDPKTSCKKKVYGYKCWARAFPCTPLSGKIHVPDRTTTEKGVDFAPWCKRKFGNAFKAKLVGRGARGWTCERSIVDRRPISVKQACQLQYGKKRVVKAIAKNTSDPYSWKCVVRK